MEDEFKRFAVYFYCFSDNCSRATAGGNETQSTSRSFVEGRTRSLSIFLLQVLINTTSKTLW